MAFDNRRTYLCYNNGDLIRDGYIRTKIEKGYIPVDLFNVRRLKNPPKGVNYVVTRDQDTQEITAVREVKKQLPASKIKIEIDFSKTMRNAVTHPITPASLGFSPLAASVAGPLMSGIGFGGITSGLSYKTMQILDAETKFNRQITATKEMMDTGIWDCDEGYPLSVFGIVTSHTIEAEEEGEEDVLIKGLDFDIDDPLKDPTIIGKYSDGLWKGTARKRISGATDNHGLFGGRGIPEIKFENVAYDDQPQLFDKIVKDNRTLKFRADNYDATGGKDYPYKLTGVTDIDVTNKQIRLKLKDDTTGELLFKEGDILYITYSVALERRIRQNYNHRGDIGQGNTFGVIGFVGAIRSEVDAFDYQIATWKVPLLPDGLEMKNIDDLDEFYTKDSDYRLTLSEYLESRKLEEEEKKTLTLNDDIEGWRLSESITNGHIEKFWAADYRGILFYDDETVTILYPESSIRDKEWFRDYLESLPFTYPSGGLDADGNEIYTTADLQRKIEDNVDITREPGFLFDLTNITNSMLFDREKIPYYRPFANALKDIRKYSEDNDDSGFGIILLDLLKVVDDSQSIDLDDMDLGLYDLSLIEFYHTIAQPQKRYPCDPPFDIHSYHYPSESYDTSTDAGGVGAWYDRGYIEDAVFEWRPSDGTIESYWKMETPYLCGEYTRKSRVYTERVSGPSLDNYAWIFVDTEPFIPHNISSDVHPIFDESIVVFNDEDVNFGLCYHKFVDSIFSKEISFTEIDESRSHIREPYDYDKDMVVGQNRMLGDIPSYSNGISIVDDVTRICHDHKGAEFWFSEEIYSGSASYGLDFNNDPPKAVLPASWYIRKLTIDFFPTRYDALTEVEKYVSFYFEGTESSISETRMSVGDIDSFGITHMVIDFNYYHDGPLQFLGEFWKKITVVNVKARYTTVNDDRNKDNLDIDDYKIKSGQNAVAYDGFGKLLVFYTNDDTGNIDVAISYDDGHEWIVHKSLIRLIEGESAGMPYVIKDKYHGLIHLFYTLNDIFIMYKIIDTDSFVYDDAFVEAKAPTSYNVDDYDQTEDDPEKGYWGDYSDKGNTLRRYPSYFIAGEATDPYFIEQMRIRDDLNNDYENSSSDKVRQYPRFEFSGDETQMDDELRGDSYCVYMDDGGVFRLFMVVDEKLTVKRSNDYFSWKYDIEEQEIHKDFHDDTLNKGIAEGIQNIQVVRNDYTMERTSVLYFHAGMLFIRHFQTDLLFPFYDSDGEMNNDDMKKHLEITEDTTHRPIFLVGNIPDSIKNARVSEIDSNISSLDSELFIYFSYDKDMLEKFDDRFEVDQDTQVYAYTDKTGVIRIFYKDSFGNLNGIILNSLNTPMLEIMNKFKDD